MFFRKRNLKNEVEVINLEKESNTNLSRFYSFFAKLSASFEAVFVLDLRALALLRIGIASVVLLDLIIRVTDLQAHYTNSGVLPLDMLFQHNWSSSKFSFHTISGQWPVQAFLFLFSAFWAFALMLGWKTRLSSFFTWIMLLSLQNRNPLILQGGDDLLRMTLFWGIFLPWGIRYSLDSKWKNNIDKSENSYLGVPGIAYMFQICFVYTFSALLKNSPEWSSQGTAIYYALSLDQMVLPLGKLIYPYPLLLKYLTLTVYKLELLAPLLFFIPLYPKFFRTLGVLVIIGFHLSIGLTLFVGLFFIIGIITTFGLIPNEVMNWVDQKSLNLKFAIGNFLDEKFNGLKSALEERIIIKLKFSTSEYIKGLGTFLVSLCLIFVTAYNLQNAGLIKDVTKPVNELAVFFRLDQNWGMFAPCVFKDDGWYIFEATTINNKKIDINQDGKPVSYIKPTSVVSLFKNDRWRKYSENYLFVSNSYMRPYFCEMIFKNWNNEHPDRQVKKLEIIYMKEVSQPDYKLAKPSREVLAVTNENEQ